MLIQLILTIFAIIVVSLFVIAVSMIVISSPATSTYLSPSTSQVQPSSAPPILWSENIRGNKNFDLFPPCYQMDTSSKHIYGIISRLQLTQRYFNFLDLLSIMLCIEMKTCNPIDIKDRFTQVLGLGGNVDDSDTRTLTMSFIPVNETAPSKFLIGCVYLLERQMKLINSDNDIPKYDKEQIKGHLYTFYSTHLSVIYKACLTG
jgi:hypothetical protein